MCERIALLIAAELHGKHGAGLGVQDIRRVACLPAWARHSGVGVSRGEAHGLGHYT